MLKDRPLESEWCFWQRLTEVKFYKRRLQGAMKEVAIRGLSEASLCSTQLLVLCNESGWMCTGGA